MMVKTVIAVITTTGTGVHTCIAVAVAVAGIHGRWTVRLWLRRLLRAIIAVLVHLGFLSMNERATLPVAL